MGRLMSTETLFLFSSFSLGISRHLWLLLERNRVAGAKQIVRVDGSKFDERWMRLD